MISKDTKKGFTLLEIMVTLVIVGVLSSMALPKLFSVVQRFRAREGETVLLALYAAQKRYYTDNDVFTDDVTKLDVSFSRLENFYPPVAMSDPNGISNYSYWQTRNVGRIQNLNQTYTLFIRNNGEIYCLDSGAYGDGAGCHRIRY